MFKIEKDIPAPLNARGAPAKYPFRQMGVGDSFAIPASDNGFYRRKNGVRGHSVQAASWYYSQKMGFKFTTRLLPDGSCRVWRIA